jgi:hypothetical protein
MGGGNDNQDIKNIAGVNLLITNQDITKKQFEYISALLPKLQYEPARVDSISQLSMFQDLLAHTALMSKGISPLQQALDDIINECSKKYGPHRGCMRLCIRNFKKAVNAALCQYFGRKQEILDITILEATGKTTVLQDNLFVSQLMQSFMKTGRKEGDEI